MDLREQKFGIEIESTGITRQRAAYVVAKHFQTTYEYVGGSYDQYDIYDNQGRKWKIMSDGSIKCQRKSGERKVLASREYSVELVSPICVYDDIETVQQLVREMREEGNLANSSTGIHIHINAEPFTAPKLKNLVNIVASKEDMIYRALQVESTRELRYCKRIDKDFLDRINKEKPKTLEHLKRIWYKGQDGSSFHYHDSRYTCLNYHSVFQKGTIEFRAFNTGDSNNRGIIHAGRVKAYIQFCMAVTAQAYNQKSASPTRSVTTNEKYSFRVWLLRLGMIGDEFKTARLHLLNHLEGNIAWKDPNQAIAQKERLRQRKETTQEQVNQETQHEQQDLEQENEQQNEEITLTM